MGVVDWLRERDHDVMHLRDENLHRMPDGDIFDKAAAEDRTVLTFDLDFGEIVAFSRGRAASVVVFRLRDTRTPSVIARLGHVSAVSGADLVRGAVVVVEDGQHRVRQLPRYHLYTSPRGATRQVPTRTRYLAALAPGAARPQ